MRELHLRFWAIYGELEQDLAGQLALAKAKGELAKEGTSPPPTAFLQVHIQGLVTFAQRHPRPPSAGRCRRPDDEPLRAGWRG